LYEQEALAPKLLALCDPPMYDSLMLFNDPATEILPDWQPVSPPPVPSKSAPFKNTLAWQELS
jgi:hypothetical protein